MPVAIILLSLLGVAFFGIRAVANPAGWPADALGIAVCFIVGVHYAKVIRSNRRIASMTTIREVSNPEEHMALIPIGPRHPLFGVMLKVERAREHLDTLDREVGEFLERELYAVAPSLNAEADRQILTLKPKLAPPAHLGVVVGDVVHNLRSALDHLACALALLDDSGDPCDKWPKPQFPLTSTQQAWLDPAAQRQIQRLSDEAKSEVDAFQPYHAGAPKDVHDHPLWVLRELSNIDKHRNINPAPLAIEFDVKSTWGREVRSDGSIELHIPSPDYLEFDIQEKLTTEVTFPLGGPSGGMDIRRLRGIHDVLLNQILPRFLRFFPDASVSTSSPD